MVVADVRGRHRGEQSLRLRERQQCVSDPSELVGRRPYGGRGALRMPGAVHGSRQHLRLARSGGTPRSRR